MKSRLSLFARAQPRPGMNCSEKKKRKKKPNFLTLPGEIRNLVYQCYFRDTYHCEHVGEGCDFSPVAPKTVKLLSNTTTPKQNHKKRQTDPEPEKPLVIRFPRSNHHTTQQPAWLNPHGALILVCKQIHAETLPFLYHRITLLFQAPRRIATFLHTLSTPTRTHITTLHLHYTTYGNPRATCDIIWQDKHIASWTRACKFASKTLVCLRKLEVDVWLSESAPKFNLRQRWLQPLWQFRRLACIDSRKDAMGGEALGVKRCALEAVEVRVRTRLWGHKFGADARLAGACRVLHGLFSQGIGKAVCGAGEVEAMAEFERAWDGEYRMWQHHLGFAGMGW